MEPLKKQRVEFSDGHCQMIEKIEDHLDDKILWLSRMFPTDPDWVYLSDLVWLETERRWLHVK